MVLWAKIGKCTCTLYEQKNPVCIQNLTCVHGDRGCGNPIPGGIPKPSPRADAETPFPGILQKPGDLPQVCPRPKSFKGLPRATHCTDRTQTSGNVAPTVELCPPHPTFRIKVRARRGVPEKRRKKKEQSKRIHVVYFQPFHSSDVITGQSSVYSTS